jgi:chromosome segregation ATPase
MKEAIQRFRDHPPAMTVQPEQPESSRTEAQRDFWKAEANRLAESLTEVKKHLAMTRDALTTEFKVNTRLNERVKSLDSELARLRANPPAIQAMVPKKVHDELKKLNDQLQDKVSQASNYIEGWRLQKVTIQELRDELARMKLRLASDQDELKKARDEVQKLNHQMYQDRKSHFRAILDELVKVIEVIKPRYLEPAQWDVINTAFDALGKPSPFFHGSNVTSKPSMR